jgi:hypothetical protein
MDSFRDGAEFLIPVARAFAHAKISEHSRRKLIFSREPFRAAAS